MNTSNRILGVDPSGAFNEGKGVTGILLLGPEAEIEHHTFVKAKDYDGQLAYWQGTIKEMEKIQKESGSVLSIEDYVLYATAASAQINSEMETSKLIGAMCMWAYNEDVPIYSRNASLVKKRWSNKILEHKGYVRKEGSKFVDKDGVWINRHVMDALRHALHCHYFELGNKKKELI